MKPEETPILQSPALLWNGKKQLSGTLVLTPKNLLFTFDDFHQSHLNLQIQLSEMEQVEEIIIYNLSRYGLKITNKDGHFDLFVLDDPVAFKKVLRETIYP